jgi:hypothetical protein
MHLMIPNAGSISDMIRGTEGLRGVSMYGYGCDSVRLLVCSIDDP